MEMLKNRLNQPLLLNRKGKKPLEIRPRGTVEVTEKDIESSMQMQELLARGDLRKLAAAAAGKVKSDKPKQKD